ncbi:MAG TPA: flagellin [Selenomonadales bacterium]|nr:flagellin [Selenomonadales bacterium]
MINNEYASLFTLRQLKNNQRKITKSLQKLASGKAINQAADNAAGLAISEKLKSIIRGTSQASRNIQDGISFLQTADGALNEIVALLQRQRELALKAANGTLTAEDRAAIQQEIKQLNDEIDHIANDTEFNKIKALRPPVGKPETKGGKADIVFIIDATGSMGGYIANVKANISAFTDALASKGIDYNLGLVVYRDVVADPSDALVKFPFTSDPDVFKTQLDTVAATGGGDLSESGLEAIVDSTLGALTYPFRESASKQFILVTDATVHDKDGDGLSSYSLPEVASQLADAKVKTSIVSNSSSESQLRQLSSASGGQYLDLAGSFAGHLNVIAGDVIDDATGDSEMPELRLQVGANAGETMTLGLFDVRSAKLGLNSLSVESTSAAGAAITTLDQALDKVSAVRSRYGAYMNNLEHTENTVLNYNENLASAQSRITDADMAKEISELTKAQIQENVSTAMASQANIAPQAILKLFNQP